MVEWRMHLWHTFHCTTHCWYSRVLHSFFPSFVCLLSYSLSVVKTHWQTVVLSPFLFKYLNWNTNSTKCTPTAKWICCKKRTHTRNRTKWKWLRVKKGKDDEGLAYLRLSLCVYFSILFDFCESLCEFFLAYDRTRPFILTCSSSSSSTNQNNHETLSE